MDRRALWPAFVAAIALLACTSSPMRAPIPAASGVGFQERIVRTGTGEPLKLAIWYPTDAKGSSARFNLYEQVVARDAPLAGASLPLVVLSHGTGGLASSHTDTALALAAAGFVAVAVNHRGDNAFDHRFVGGDRWIVQRVEDVSAALDFMEREWPSRAALDRGRIGAFGYSAGATTVLMALGAELDGRLIETHCARQAELACQLWKGARDATLRAREPRIRAAVIAAPGYGFAFAPESLARIAAPVQLWAATRDEVVPAATNTALVGASIPDVDLRSLGAGGHFAFLAPCPAGIAMDFCRDPEGFDRAAQHARMNREIVAFFRRTLQGTTAAGTRR